MASADMLDAIRGKLPAIGTDRWVFTDGARPGLRAYAELVPRGGEGEPPDAGLAGDDPYNIIARRLLHAVRRRVPHDAGDVHPAPGT